MEIKKIIDAAATHHVQALSFTGGEPLLFFDDLIDLIHYADRSGIPYIRTGTNGFLFKNGNSSDFMSRVQPVIEQLSTSPIRNFWFSIDSAEPDIHEELRGLPGLITGIKKALPLFHAAGLYPSANLGINRYIGGRQTADLAPSQFNNRKEYLTSFFEVYSRAFEQFYQFVHRLGFTIVNTCYPISISEHETEIGLEAVYPASSVDRMIRFAPDEKAMLFEALLGVVPKYRQKLRIFSPLCNLYRLKQQYLEDFRGKPFGCRGGVDFFFFDAVEGNTYPCGYRGKENLGKFWELDVAGIRPQDGCHRCDWECFRDPSEMCAPLLQACSQPSKLISFCRKTSFRAEL
jgi:MoaA/NifB/PqqE/SkfB family radical SAM enzyme